MRMVPIRPGLFIDPAAVTVAELKDKPLYGDDPTSKVFFWKLKVDGVTIYTEPFPSEEAALNWFEAIMSDDEEERDEDFYKVGGTV